MIPPNTHNLNDNTFVDAFGFFALKKEDAFEMVVPDYISRGKLAKYRGQKIRLTRICRKHYGDIIEITSIGPAQYGDIKTINLKDFKRESAKFHSIPVWNQQKRTEGQNLFAFLRGYNPVYFQRNKLWIKQYRETSKIGDYFMLTFSGERGMLRDLNSKTCLIVVTYNKAYKHGFMAIPVV